MLEQKKREVKFFSLPFILRQIYSTNRFKLKLSMKRRLKVFDAPFYAVSWSLIQERFLLTRTP